MNRMIATFGDSWPAGEELIDPATESYGAMLARNLNYDGFVNFGEPASSIDHMVVQLIRFTNILKNHPDTEWLLVFDFTQTGRHLFFDPTAGTFIRHGELHNIDDQYPHMRQYAKKLLGQVDFELYNGFCAGRAATWLQNFCKTNDYKYLCIKHLQDFPESDFNHLIDWSHFYNSGKDICRDFIAEAYIDVVWQGFNWNEVKYGQAIEDESTRSKFFQGSQWHPNSLGHALIANRLEALYNSLYSGG